MHKELDTVLKTLGIAELPKDEQEILMIHIADAIIPAIVVDCIPRLSSKEQSDFESILDEETKGPLEALRYLEDTIKDFRSIVAYHAKKYLEDVNMLKHS